MTDKTVLQIARWVIMSLLALAIILLIVEPLAGVIFAIASAVGYNVLTVFYPRVSHVLQDDRRKKWQRFSEIFRLRKKPPDPTPGPMTFTPDHFLVCSLCTPPISHLINKESVIIGRDETCDLCLRGNPSIGLRHCRIFYRSHSRQYFIEDLRSKSGTFLGTKRLEPYSPQQLTDNQEIVICNQRFRFSREPLQSPGTRETVYDPGSLINGPTVAETMGVRLTFRINYAGREREETRVISNSFTIGRASECSLVLMGDDKVSNKHALLFAQNGIVMVVDMGSTNGTYIDGSRVPKGSAGAPNATQLANYAVMKIGGHTLSVSY